MNASDARDESLFDARGFGQRIGFGDRPALLVIDIIRAFTDPESPLGSDLDAETGAIRRVAAAASKNGAPIIYSTIAYQDPECRDGGIMIRKSKGAVILREGTPGVELDSRLEFRPGDTLLAKKHASCFFGTDLVQQLVLRHVDTLLITGCTTSGCVRATAVDACQLGFRPMVVREAVGDRSQRAHEQSLFDLDAKYADVVSLQDALAYLRRVGHSDERAAARLNESE